MTSELDLPRPPAPCERVRARLDLFLDGGLPPLERARDAGHLEACAACSQEVRRRRAFLADLRALEQPLDGELAYANAGLAERLAAARAPKRVWIHDARRALRAAAVAAAAVATLSGLRELGAFEPGVAELFRTPRIELERDVRVRFTWPADLRAPWGG